MLNPFLKLRTAHYYILYNGLFAFASCFIKTSIGIAIIRISTSRIYTYTICVCLIAANVSLIAAFIWSLTLCSPVEARWNPLLGTCKDTNPLPPIYTANSFALVVDMACAAVPVFILQRLTMPRRTKYGLMALLGMGGATVVVVAARFPCIESLNHTTNALCRSSPFVLWSRYIQSYMRSNKT